MGSLSVKNDLCENANISCIHEATMKGVAVRLSQCLISKVHCAHRGPL